MAAEPSIPIVPHFSGRAPGAPKTPGPVFQAPASTAAPAPGWRSRGYLPHRDELGLLQFITYRLADSLPQDYLRRLEATLATLPETDRETARRKQIETWLDSGLGCCALRHPALAATVEAAFFHADGTRYRLLAWCVMPNHVHVLIQPQAPLAEIVRTWKSYTARWALERNAELRLRIPGRTLWLREYWDRFIRDAAHFRRTLDYIHDNPVHAKLCATPSAWPWSSARHAPGTAGLLPGNACSSPGTAGLPPGLP